MTPKEQHHKRRKGKRRNRARARKRNENFVVSDSNGVYCRACGGYSKQKCHCDQCGARFPGKGCACRDSSNEQEEDFERNDES